MRPSIHTSELDLQKCEGIRNVAADVGPFERPFLAVTFPGSRLGVQCSRQQATGHAYHVETTSFQDPASLVARGNDASPGQARPGPVKLGILAMYR